MGMAWSGGLAVCRGVRQVVNCIQPACPVMVGVTILWMVLKRAIESMSTTEPCMQPVYMSYGDMNMMVHRYGGYGGHC